MTMSQKKAAEARRVLVHAVREARRRNITRNYLEIEERIIPCCASCEHNRAAVCTARPVPGFETNHRHGHTITDPEDLREFHDLEYRFSAEHSSENNYVFVKGEKKNA